MDWEFKIQIKEKIDSAVNRTIESSDVEKEKLEQFKKQAQRLRESLKKSILKDNILDEDRITNDEWQEIFDSFPKDLLAEFGIEESEDLRDFILFGEKLNDAQRELFEFNIPEKITFRNLSQISGELNKLSIDIHYLGGNREKFNNQEAKTHAQTFQKKLADISIQTKEFQRSAQTESEKKLAGEVEEIVIHLDLDLQKFIDGNFFQQLKYDPVQTEGIEKHDVRSTYTKYGIEGNVVGSFIENGVSEGLIAKYHKEGLLQEDFYPFILNHVPVEVVKNFLSLFSSQEKATAIYDLRDNNVAEILFQIANTPPLEWENCVAIDLNFVAEYIKKALKDGSSLSRELLGKYYPELLSSYETTDPYDRTKKETKYHIPLNEIQLVFDKMEGNNNEEKLNRFQAYKELGLKINEILVSNAIPALSPDNIQRQISESKDLFTVYDIYAIHVEGLNLNELRLFYESLPTGANKSTYEFSDLKEALPNTPMVKILPYIPFMKGIDSNIGRSISYFLDNNILPATVQDYKNVGINGLNEIERVMKSNIPLKYLQDLRAIGIQESNVHIIMDWYKAELTAKQIKPFFELRDSEKVDYEVLKPENIKKYWKIIDSKEKHEQLLSLIVAGISIEESLTAVEKNLALKDVQMVKKYKLDVSWVETFKKYDLVEFVQILESQNERNLPYSLKKIVPLLEACLDRSDVKEMLQLDFNLSFAKSTHEAGENWREYLPYKEFANYDNLQALQMMKLFQVSPDNLKRYCKQYPHGGYDFNNQQVDAVILSEYEKGNLPEEARQFLEKHNLSFPNRYPISILKQMKNVYESVERQGKSTAILIIGKNDWNGAFEGGRPYEDLLKGYNVFIYEVSSENDFIKTVKTFGTEQENAGKKIDLMIIGGHGYPGGINFSVVKGEQSELDISDSEDLKGLDKFLAPNGKIVLRSCSTGKGGAEANNIASTISKAFGGISVLAPSIPTNIEAFRYDENDKVIGVDYNDKGVEEEISIIQIGKRKNKNFE